MDPVVHFEMPYDNRDRIAKFYSTVFGWELRMLGEEMGNYVVATTAKPGGTVRHDAAVGAIGGGFFQRKADWPAQYPSIVIAVDDIRAAMKKVNANGGETIGDPMMIPGVGDYVGFYDTEKNRVSLLQPLPRQ
jgi:predicted enzyme related to lactoylglutathione lyase